MDNRPIGVFDSGVGGLTVVKELMEQLPNESIVYFGDTARVPYGTKSKETVTKFSFQNIRFLMSKGVKAVVIACNTSSSSCLEEVQEAFDIPIIGVILPGAETAVKVTKNGRIGVIGTERTISSGAYEKAIKRIRSDVKILNKACPLFVPIVEEGWADTEVAYLVAKEYLATLKEEDIDTLVMGCTHYPLLVNTLRKVMGEKVVLVNPAYETARSTKVALSELGLDAASQNLPEYRYYVSDNPEKFAQIGENFLKKKLDHIEHIDIERY